MLMRKTLITAASIAAMSSLTLPAAASHETKRDCLGLHRVGHEVTRVVDHVAKAGDRLLSAIFRDHHRR